MDNGVEPPLLPDVTNNPAVNHPDFFKIRDNGCAGKMGGLQSSYRWTA
jgi:hypothetical protein